MVEEDWTRAEDQRCGPAVGDDSAPYLAPEGPEKVDGSLRRRTRSAAVAGSRSTYS